MHLRKLDKYSNLIPIGFFMICVAVLSTQIMALFLLAEIADYGITLQICMAVSDSLLILSPYLLLKPRWRRTIIVPMTLIPIFLYANLLYYRNFHDIMGFKTMFGFSNLTGTVSDSAFASVQNADLWFLIPFVVFILLYAVWWRRFAVSSFSTIQRIYSMVVILALFAFTQSRLIAHTESRYNPETCSLKSSVNSETFYYNKFKDYMRTYRLRYYSLVPYFFREFYDYVKPEYRTASVEERKMINEFISRKDPEILDYFDSLPDNKGKNLILIVVESLNSDALYLTVNSQPAMPNLWNLIGEASSVIIADNVIPQIGDGRSSDGRFIYNTGILPPPHDPVAMSHPNANYPSLAKAFNGNAEEFDIGNPLQWNKGPMSKSYGYRKIHVADELSANMGKLGGRDGALLVNSVPKMAKMQQPFLATLCTMDMHDPYTGFKWNDGGFPSDSAYTQKELVYLRKVRQFDRALSKFVSRLKEANLYDNSVIAIVSDHTARESCLDGNHFIHARIPLIIFNSGVNLRTSMPVVQTDIYPTLLDIMGRGDYKWRGFGSSMLRNPSVLADDKHTLNDTIPSDPELLCLSELMLSTGWFK